MKKTIRQEKISARKSLNLTERMLFRNAITNKLLNSDFYKDAKTIMLYQAINGEVDLSEFAKVASKDGKKLYYPKCISKTEMIALSTTENVWIEGRFGIKEPNIDMAEQIKPNELDLIICPCTSFDETCNRLGMGAGYYDRFLENCSNAYRIAVAFEVQKVDRIPVDIYDKMMDMIVTEKQTYKSGLERRNKYEF